jgi:SulP family sulfate permease
MQFCGKGLSVFFSPEYNRDLDLKGDIIAGISVGLMLVPQSMAHASIMGVRPENGMHAATAPLLVYALTGSSRHIAMGTGALVSVILDGHLSAYPDPLTKTKVAVLLCFLMGLWQMCMGFLKLGFLSNFMSRPVISGFVSGGGLIIIGSQLKHILGVVHERSPFLVVTIYRVTTLLQNARISSICVGTGSMLIIAILRRYKGKIGAVWDRVADVSALIVVIVSSVISKILSSHPDLKLNVVGEVQGGLPPLKSPFSGLDYTEVAQNTTTSIVVALVMFVCNIAVAKKYAIQYKYSVDANTELISTGLSAVAGSFIGAIPVQGSLSRTALNAQNARSQVSSLVSFLILVSALMYAMPVIFYLPKSALAAIIIMASINLVDLQHPIWLLKLQSDRGLLGWIRNTDFLCWLVAVLSTVTVGVIAGIAFSISISLVLLIYRTAKPVIKVLGRLPSKSVDQSPSSNSVYSPLYDDVGRHDDAQTFDNVLICRQDARLYFANAEPFVTELDRLTKHAAVGGTEIRAVVLDFGAINVVDASAILVLFEVVESYSKRDIILVVANANGEVRDIMQASGALDELSQSSLLMDVHQAVLYAQQCISRSELGESSGLLSGVHRDYDAYSTSSVTVAQRVNYAESHVRNVVQEEGTV